MNGIKRQLMGPEILHRLATRNDPLAIDLDGAYGTVADPARFTKSQAGVMMLNHIFQQSQDRLLLIIRHLKRVVMRLRIDRWVKTEDPKGQKLRFFIQLIAPFSSYRPSLRSLG